MEAKSELNKESTQDYEPIESLSLSLSFHKESLFEDEPYEIIDFAFGRDNGDYMDMDKCIVN